MKVLLLLKGFVIAFALQADENAVPPFEIGQLLATAVKDIPHLNIVLRSTHLHVDADNAYISWFLNNSSCLMTISSYDEQMQSLQRRIARRNSKHIDDVELRQFWSTLWSRFSVFNSYMLTPKGVLVYDPFEFDVSLQTYGKIMSYDGRHTLESLLFHDMRGYPLRIQIFKSVYARPHIDQVTRKIKWIEGVDGEVAKLLQECMNFTMDLQDPDPDYFGERDINGTYNGVIGSIINGSIDISLNGFFVKDYMVPEMDFSVAVYDDQLCIYVPKAKRVPQSILPILSVRSDLWISFIAAAFVCAAIWSVMRFLNLRLGISKTVPIKIGTLKMQLMRIYIDTWVLWVRVNLVRYPPFNSERVYIASLCLVSVIFGAIFESSLATVYIHPMYYKDITTLLELDQSGLNVIYKYSSMADDLFFSETSSLFASLNKKLTHLRNLNADVMLDIVQNGGKAGVTRYTSLMLESMEFIISKKVWIVPECPKYYTISYVMPKDSPWQSTVNDLLLRFLNAGLIHKWITDMQTRVDIELMKQPLIDASSISKVLTVGDLQLAFYVIFMGCALAFSSLIMERYIWATPNPSAVSCGE